MVGGDYDQFSLKDSLFISEVSGIFFFVSFGLIIVKERCALQVLFLQISFSVSVRPADLDVGLLKVLL